ncbi:MAG TPA: pyridoxal-dependent decarboxylase [Gemmatimonadaceae bacterium]|nr:pyridoxal-dependent decarboxylase [Gemmatimonadaceae bacterium]
MISQRVSDAAPDLSRQELHAALARVTAWIESYLADPGRFPVLPKVAPGEVTARLPNAPPDAAEPMDAILDDFERVLLPGITHWNHPGFFAYFAITGSAPGVLAEMLAAALNVNAMLWKTSPAATELEARALDWLRQMLGLGEGWFGVINDTASISTLLALAAAREAKPELEVRRRGMAGRADLPVLRVYASEHAHSSVDKSALTLGFGHENVVHIPADDAFRMRPDALERAIAEDRLAGRLPIAVVATVGTTSTASIDPVPAIAAICEREKLWLHVDASYAGVAAIVPECRDTLAGVDRADSLVVNPHKWLFTPVDLSALYTRRPDVLKRAFSLVPDYLVTAEQDEVVNLMDYGVQLGRRFRALKLWMVIRAFGVSGIVERLRQHMALAREFAGWIEKEPEWTLAAPQRFSLVCFRFAPSGVPDEECDRLNQRILDAVNASGRVYLSHTKLSGRVVLRLAIGNLRTGQSHVEEAWSLLRDAASSSRAHRE